MSQRARVLVLAIVGGVATAASAVAVETLIGVAALLLLILGSTLAIGNAIATDSSEPAGRAFKAQVVAIDASHRDDKGAPISLHPSSDSQVTLLRLEVDDEETGRATPWLLRTGGRR